jgi:hypothetical protein
MSVSKILLINFRRDEKEKLSEIGLDFERGYISDKTSIVQMGFRSDAIKYSFPHSIYEYKAIIINLNKNKELDDEFNNESKWVRSDVAPADLVEVFSNYWTKGKGIVILFLGDFSYNIFSWFGLHRISLINIEEKDKTCIAIPDDISNLGSFFHDVSTQVKMPTEKYIEYDERWGSSTQYGTVIKTDVYKNLGEKILGCYLSFYSNPTQYISIDEKLVPLWEIQKLPRFIMLPQFRNNTLVIKDLLKELTNIYIDALPEIYEPDWIESDEFYPSGIKLYDSKISETKKELEEKIDLIKKEKAESKQKYEYIRKLLYATGEELKQSVIQVLEQVFKLHVVDVDKTDSNKQLAEDILIEFNGRRILTEIKGVKQKNPSPTFIGQVWKHIAISDNKKISEGALILNFDMHTNPNCRPIAYAGELEEQLKDIIFIDTRVMFNLALAIIGNKQSLPEAQEILLKKGRVAFTQE